MEDSVISVINTLPLTMRGAALAVKKPTNPCSCSSASHLALQNSHWEEKDRRILVFWKGGLSAAVSRLLESYQAKFYNG